MADDWLIVSPSGSISSVKSLNLYGSDLSLNECEIIKQGSLTKKAEYKKTWRSRYFILFKNGLLLGFEKKPTSKNLKNCNNRFNVTRCETIKCERSEFLIRMYDDKKRLVSRRLRADSDELRDEWIDSFESVKQNYERKDIDPSDLSNFVDIESLRQVPLSSATKDDFKYIKQLGKGTFGSVWLVKHRMEYYAMKVIPKKVLKNSKEKEHLRQERRIIEKNNFPFLIKLEYAFQTVDKLFMVMEYAAGGELYFHLSQERTFSEEKTRFYISEIVVAIEHLHSNDIIYRDLKLENILLDAEGHIKLVDFGLSKRLMSADEKTQTFCGTPGYIAPEVIDNEYYFFGYGKEIDWWSLGIIFFEMICGRSPFGNDDQNPQKIFNRILYSKVDMRPAPRRTSNHTKDLIMALLEKEPEERIGSEELGGVDTIKNHPFFDQTDWNRIIKRQCRPPFIPNLDSDEDVSYFDQAFQADSHVTESSSQSCRNFSHVTSFSYDVQSKFNNSECG